MNDKDLAEKEEIYSKVMRAGRRTYFFDVKSTKAGDYYLTITESKKFTHEDGTFHFKKHKVYLYKEDFSEFKDLLNEMIDYIHDEKGEYVPEERHASANTEAKSEQNGHAEGKKTEGFTDISFDDI